MAEVTNDLIYEVLKSIPERMGRLETNQRDFKLELQGIRGHLAATTSEVMNIYSRLGHVEDRLERVEKRLGLIDVDMN